MKRRFTSNSLSHSKGASGSGGRNAEDHEGVGEAAQAAQPQQLPIDLVADAKLQQLQPLPRPHEPPSAASDVNALATCTAGRHTNSLQEPVERDPDRNLAARSQLVQHASARQANKTLANIDGDATTTAGDVTQCHHHQQPAVRLQHVQQQQHDEQQQRANARSASAQMSNKNR